MMDAVQSPHKPHTMKTGKDSTPLLTLWPVHGSLSTEEAG